MSKPILFSGEMVLAILSGKKSQTRRIVKPQPPASIGECPYGIPGEHLWVRETWCPRSGGKLAMDSACVPRFRADGELRPEWGFKWRASIHMPRWACRIVLEVKSTRVERVQSISEEDAIAEGIDLSQAISKPIHGWTPAKLEYSLLWDRINGKDPTKCWKANPWVWVIEFKRHNPDTAVGKPQAVSA